MVALGAFVLVGAVVGATGSTRPIALAALAGAGVQVVASTALVSPLGLLGAGLASGFGYLAAALLLVANQARVVSGRDGIVTAGAVAVAAAGLVVGSAVTDSSIAVRALTVLAFGVITLLVARAIFQRGGWSDTLH
jgi:hypothetical protein